MQLQSYVAVQTSGFVCKVRIENIYSFLSAETHMLLVVLCKKTVFLKATTCLRYTTENIQADKNNFNTKTHKGIV